jgi:hypothetical protein
MGMDTFTDTRTAKDPAAYVASFAQTEDGLFFWGHKYYRVTLGDILPGETKSGRKRFVVKFEQVR